MKTNVLLEQYFIWQLAWLYSDSLRVGRCGDRIPVGAKFSALVQTGPGAHPASYTMGVASFPGVKRSGRDFDHPPPSSAEVKERVELFGPSWPVLGWTLPLPLLALLPADCFAWWRAAQHLPQFQFAVSWGTRFLVQWLQLVLTYLSYCKKMLGMFSFSKQTYNI